MKIRYSSVFAMLLRPLSVRAQTGTAPPSAGVAAAGARTTFVYRGELGKWWQNSDVARKLQLSDGQISQLDQTFYDHKLKLIDYGAELLHLGGNPAEGSCGLVTEHCQPRRADHRPSRFC